MHILKFFESCITLSFIFHLLPLPQPKPKSSIKPTQQVSDIYRALMCCLNDWENVLVGKILSKVGTPTRNVWNMVDESKRWVDGDFYQTRILYSHSLPNSHFLCPSFAVNLFKQSEWLNMNQLLFLHPCCSHIPTWHTGTHQNWKNNSCTWEMRPAEEHLNAALRLCVVDI